MAVADTLFLLGLAWFMPVILMTVFVSGVGEDIPHFREYVFM
jgi:hypothetical protein